MRERNIAWSIVFCLITCGIYQIYWFIVLNDEANEEAQVDGVSGVTAFLFSLITCGIYGLFWAYKMGEKTEIIRERNGVGRGSDTGVLYLILALLGFQIVTLALIQNELNKTYRPA